jgi:hypothetical protein
MSEPAIDEADLVEQVALAILDYGVINNTISTLATSALAAIRAAGWAVVPVEPTEDMIRATDRDEHFLWTDDEITKWEWAAMLAAAPGVKP